MVSPLRYAANCDLSDPKTVQIGFNLSDCAPGQLSSLPAGTKGLVWLGSNVFSTMKPLIDACVGHANLWGFYIYDEPDISLVSAASLKTISDYCHSTIPGCKTFIALVDGGDGITPNYAPSAPYGTQTGIDYFGVSQYPVQINIPDANIESEIARYISNVQSAGGFPLAKLVPIMQCAGGDGVMILPTTSQQTRMFTAWDAGIPNPVFEYTYEWGLNSNETASLMTSAALQTVYQNRFTSVPPSGEAYFTGTAAPTTAIGAVGDVYAQVTTQVTQGAPTVTVPPPNVTVTTKFWKKTSTGWVAK